MYRYWLQVTVLCMQADGAQEASHTRPQKPHPRLPGSSSSKSHPLLPRLQFTLPSIWADTAFFHDFIVLCPFLLDSWPYGVIKP